MMKTSMSYFHTREIAVTETIVDTPLCGYHHAEGHSGRWKDCPRCCNDFETEMYVYYGTNEYNFAKLENPPAYDPTRCSKCGTVIVLSEGGYSRKGEEYWCGECTDSAIGNFFRRTRRSSRGPSAGRR